jgi:hypothetical protein
MSGEIVFAKIGFNLDDFADALNAGRVVNQPLAQQFLRDENGVAVVKWARQFLHGGSLAQFPD